MQNPDPAGVLPWPYIPAIWMGRNASVPVEHHQIQSWLEKCGLEESSAKVHFTGE